MTTSLDPRPPRRRPGPAPWAARVSWLAWIAGPLVLALLLVLPACKKKEGETCKPEEKNFTKVRVVVQPTPDINPDPEGTPRATSLRVYQLKGGRTLDVPLDFLQVWKDAPSAFGDELLKEEELTIYPDKLDVFEIEPDPEATHLVAAAIFREPLGSSWYAEWEVPQYHGDSVCMAEKKKQTYEDPCFLVFMEGSQIDGGHKPPPGMEVAKLPVTCPPEPLKVKPAPEVDPKQKKKEERKKKRKERREKAKGKAGEAQDSAGEAQDKADAADAAGDKASSAGDKVANPEAPEAPKVPGKD